MSTSEYFQARSDIFRQAREKAAENFRRHGIHYAVTAQDAAEFAAEFQLPPLPFENPRRSHLNPDPTEGRVPPPPSPDPNDLEYSHSRSTSNPDPFGPPPIVSPSIVYNTPRTPSTGAYPRINRNHPPANVRQSLNNFRWSETPCPRRGQATPSPPLTPSFIKQEDIQEVRQHLQNKRKSLVRLIARQKATVTARLIKQQTPVRRSPRSSRYTGTYRH